MAAKAAALNIEGYTPPAAEEEKDYEVRADCSAAVQMFIRMISAPSDGPVGPASAEWMFRLYEVQEPRQMLEDLRVMELAWLEECRKGAE